VKYFVLTRQRDGALEVSEFLNRDAGLEALKSREADAVKADSEVVFFAAPDLENLQRTHGRFFERGRTPLAELDDFLAHAI
jgi:hypothetical protein